MSQYGNPNTSLLLKQQNIKRLDMKIIEFLWNLAAVTLLFGVYQDNNNKTPKCDRLAQEWLMIVKVVYTTYLMKDK